MFSPSHRAPLTERRLAIEILHREGLLGALLAPAHIAERPVALGSASELCIPREGIAPLHLYLLVERDRLLVTLADASAAAFGDDGDAIPAAWTELALPCHLLLGETVLRLFWCFALVDAEKPERARPAAVRRKWAERREGTPLPPITPPPRRPLPPPRTPARMKTGPLHGAPYAPMLDWPPPPPPRPPRPFAPRLGDALSSPPLAVTPAMRSPPGPKPSQKKTPVAVVVESLVAAWRRFEAFVVPPGTPAAVRERSAPPSR